MRFLLGAAIILVAVGLVLAGSLADSVRGQLAQDIVIPGNTFSVKLEPPFINFLVLPREAVVVGLDMQPNQSVIGGLILTNAGNVDLRYSMTSTTTGGSGLARALEMTIKADVTLPCLGGFEEGGTIIYSGKLADISEPTALFGNASIGQNPGDRVLFTGVSDFLCIKVLLPLTGAGFGGLFTSAEFLLHVEEVQ